MKFIKLEIQNLASLDRQGGETINFEEGALGESTIFSIVGPTGSGKSTILDAICLALYNRAPRYPRKKGDRNQNIEIFGEPEADEKSRLAPTDSRNIITRGKKEGYSKLTFLANNGTVYRAEWYVRMKTKKFDDPILSLYKISMNNGAQSEEIAEWDKLPQIIGLDYDQFLRTVLIAQGSFANFLTAKENERYELLEKLIGCEKLYSNIATKIRLQRDEAVKAYDLIAANCKAQEKDIIPEEELDTVTSRIVVLEAIEKQAKEELTKVTEALAWYSTNEKYEVNISKFQMVFNEAKEKLEEFGEQANRLSLHDATLRAVDLFKDIKTSETNITSLEKTLSNLAGTISKKEADIKNEEDINLKQLIDIAQKASEELDKQKPLINKAREIKAQLQPLQTTLNDKKRIWNASHKDANDALNLVTDKTIDLDSAEELYTKEKLQLEERNKKSKEDLDSPSLSTTELSKELLTLRDTRTLITSENLTLQRQNLEEGKACPLCGATHHPYQNTEEYSKVTTELDNLIINKEKEITDRQNRILELQKHFTTSDPLYLHVEMLRLATDAAKKLAKARQDKAEYDSAEAALQNKRNELKAIIGDKDPDAYEKSLSDAKTKVEKDVQSKNETISRMREQLNEDKGKEAATKSQMEKEMDIVSNKKVELENWLSNYNKNNADNLLSEESIAQLYSSTENWENIRATQKRLSDAYTSAETTLNNETKACNEHQEKKPEQEKEKLAERKTELEAQSNQELIDSKARLQRHNTAKEQMGSMLPKMQEAELTKKEWEEIADAIGGDGKTLRKIAQCYTLRFLIEHANAEIRKFNSRYELQQVKNSLGIRVIDHDRADDVRDTTSLSGGETFIVSLGLALGLSALSSRNISFENLFIDEGFGTLDPDTLDTVIDSLSMLQSSQGKKVGVISHTDTMFERIATQIRIIKNGNSGSSHIEIYP